MKPRSATGVATTGICALAVATVIAGPPLSERPAPVPVIRDVALTSAAVPPGGLLASVLINQVTYCAIICPLVVDTAVTAGVATLGVPVTFLTALQSGDLVQAVGAAAALVTGPINKAAQATILADGSRVAPRFLNALEVGVVGLLDVLPATADGIPGVARALQTARQDTFTALNAPIVADPAPLATPQGVLQVAVVASLDVVGAVVFPAFNEILSAVFDAPDAFARELAESGRLGRAVGAGVRNAASHVHAAVSVVGQTVHTGLQRVAAAVEQSRADRRAEKRAERAGASPGERPAGRTHRDHGRGDGTSVGDRRARTDRDDVRPGHVRRNGEHTARRDVRPSLTSRSRAPHIGLADAV